jgi:hypothetical protein
MNKKILIHIGPPKSGTSAIQYELHNNRAILRSEGVEYPAHEIGPNGISSGNMQAILSLNDEGKWRVCEDKVRILLYEFNRSNLHTLLLSSEYFFYLVKDIAKLMPQALYITYLRCPLETFESSYNQSVKRHMKSSELTFGKNLHMTTLNILSETIQEIGKKRFVLRAYLPLSAGDYNLIDDFWSAINLPHLPSSRVITNNSYSFEALEFKRWLNQFELVELDASIDQALQAYSDGPKVFSFLPQELFERYQKQALHNIRDFIHENKVFNGKVLISYLKNRPCLEQQTQALSDEKFIAVCTHLARYHPVLYTQICSELRKYILPNVEHVSRINIVINQKISHSTLLSKILYRLKW